jgi:hypothetical protein
LTAPSPENCEKYSASESAPAVFRGYRREDQANRISRAHGVLENRKYDAIQFRNGYATNAPEMVVEFLGVRRIRKWGKSCYAIRLGRILKIKRCPCEQCE